MKEPSATLIELTAPIRRPGSTNAQALHVWLQTNRYFWMLATEEFANQTENIVGTKMLITMVALYRQWKKGKARDHPALRVPEEPAQEKAFARLERFLDLYIKLDAAPPLPGSGRSVTPAERRGAAWHRYQ